MYCQECGNKLNEGASFCTNCGARNSVEEKTSSTPAVTMDEVEAAEEVTTGSYSAKEVEEVVVEAFEQREVEVEPSPIPTPTPAQEAKPNPTPRPTPTPQPISSGASRPVVDSRDMPMTLGGWIGTMLLLLIPIVNIILVFVWAFGSDTNRSKKTYFQAMLILWLVGVVLSIVFGSAIAIMIASFTENMYY